MNVRKEPLVLGATVITVGLLVYSSLGTERRTPSGKRGQKPVLEQQRVPDVSVTTPAPRDLGRPLRDLFSPPSDTHPLPPLDIDPPPFAPLSAVFPPTSPGPEPALYGKLLRADPTPTFVPALFAAEDAASTETAAATDNRATGNTGALKTLGYVASSNSQEALTAEQRAAQVAGYKKLYDWFRHDDGAIEYGRIRNKDKFALKSRLDEAVVVVRIDPVTGKDVTPVIEIPFARNRVNEFHFADTVANRIAERRRDFGDKVTPGQYSSVMTFADECVASRNEAAEALDLAIEMYTLAETITPSDPAPRLGLARCYELKFDFESAYSQLESLLAKYEHSPEIQVRLGQLEARLRLFASAEQRFVLALRGARQSFDGQWAYGRFLLERNRPAEALEHLELAHQFEPPAEQQAQRLGVRLDLAAARFANGKLDEANSMYDSALAIEPRDSRGLAGKLAILVVKKAPTNAAVVLGRDQAGFEMLLAQGLAKLQSKQWPEARDLLLAAAGSDPLRAHAAWRALSWLAEVTGYPAEALRYVELALEAAPDDAWSLYQHGRLLVQREDPESAKHEFKAALDRELAFTDAIASLGQIAAAGARPEDAEMYFGRALDLDKARPELEARRGYNYLSMNDAARAEACFLRAKAIDASEPGMLAGLAWCAYRKNDADGAVVAFRKLDDDRRTKPEKDAWRVFANRQINRVQVHVAKEAWEDNFDRGTRLANGWDYEEAAGPTWILVDNAMTLRGDFKQTDGRVRMLRSMLGGDFVSLEADVTVHSASIARVALFLSREKQQQGRRDVTSQISVERHPEGALQVLLMDRATTDPERTDIAPVGGVPWWPADKVVRLRIERLGEGSDSTGRISVDGIPVASGFSMRSIASSAEIFVGISAQANSGQHVDLVVDNVQVVRTSKH